VLSPVTTSHFGKDVTHIICTTTEQSLQCDAIAVTFCLILISTEGKILELEFIQVSLDGVTVNPNEKIILGGIMEIRLSEKTVDARSLPAQGLPQQIRTVYHLA